MLKYFTRSRLLRALTACLVIAAFAQPASAAAITTRVAGRPTTVNCKRVASQQIRCTMTIKRGGAVSGTVTMRITRGKVVFARGRGRIRHGKATLTMHLLRRMPPGRYTVTMVVKLTSKTKVRRKH